MSVEEAVGRAVAAEWDEMHECGDEACDFEARLVAAVLGAAAGWVMGQAMLARDQAIEQASRALAERANGLALAARLLMGEAG